MANDFGPILIVDQDQGSRAFAARLFERAGFAIDEAASGEEAMASAREVRPSLVLLDVVLPDLSGFEIARELRDEFGDDLPIIFISGETARSRSTGQPVYSWAATTTSSNPPIRMSCLLAQGD